MDTIILTNFFLLFHSPALVLLILIGNALEVNHMHKQKKDYTVPFDFEAHSFTERLSVLCNTQCQGIKIVSLKLYGKCLGIYGICI